MKSLVSFSIGMATTIIGFSLYYDFSIYAVLLSLGMVLLSFGSALIASKFNYQLIIIIPITSIFISAVYIFKTFGDNIVLDRFSITNIVFSIMMIIFAIISKSIKQNETFGIRTVLTMEFEEVWDKTHKNLSWIIALFLPFIFANVFFGSGYFRLLVGVVCVITPLIIATIYSYVIGHKFYMQKRELEIIELEKQERLEEMGNYHFK